MILTTEQVVELAKLPVDPVIEVNGDLQLRHKLHITGEGFENHLKKQVDYESDDEFDFRCKEAKDFTRLVTNEIVEAQSRWKSAQGTTKYYNFGEKGQEKAEAFKKEILSQVWKGGSIKQFIDNFASKAIYEEFNGFYLVEKGAKHEIENEDGSKTVYEIKNGIATKVKPNADFKPYIIFKSVNEVRRFKVTGKRVEYIILNYGEVMRGEVKVCLYRVIDDLYDYIVEVYDTVADDKSTVTNVVISDEFPPLEHKAGRCPVVRCSTLNKYISDDNTLTSVIDNLLGPLDNLLTEFDDHATTARKHGFPLMWMMGTECKYTHPEKGECNSGLLNWQYAGEWKQESCPACKGGAVKTTPNSVMLVPAKDVDGKPYPMQTPGGYIERDIQTFQQQRENINWWIQQIISAGTGIKNGVAETSIDKTATEVVMNTKPLEDIISKNIDIIESVEKDLTDLLGKIYYGDAYKGCEILYGRRLNLRDENTLLAEIKEAKASGASYMHIKQLCEELTYTRFVRSEIDLRRNLILNELEPFIGFTYTEIEASNSIDKRTKLYKQNFTDIIQAFELQEGMVEDFEPGKTFPERIKSINEKIKAIIDERDFTTVKKGQLSEKQLDAQAQLRGTVGGTQGLIELNASVSLGQIDEETAITIVEQIYGYERSVAAKMITSVDKKPTPQIKEVVPATPAT